MESFSSWILLALPVGVVVAAIYHIIYNIYLHPLASTPGSKLWAATRIPWCWYQYQGTLQHKLLELHIQYGSAVRTAPNEISFTTDTAWKTIYGHRSAEMSKDPNFKLLTPTGAQNLFVSDRETHTRQRRLMAHAFSERALREQESILLMHINKFLEQLSRRAGTEALNMSAWINYLTFDLISDMAFGEPFGSLDEGKPAPFVSAITPMATELTLMQMWKYWGLMSIRPYFTPKDIAGKRVENIKRAMKSVGKRMQFESERKDFMHYILAANDEKGMSEAEIHVNAFSLLGAGSESTGTAMCGVLFFTLTNPATFQRLVNEIRAAFSSEEEISIANTNNLTYLEAVIQEALRMYPPVAISMPRRTPVGGETIDGIYVPEDMTVGVNPYSAYRHPDNWYRPDDFLPERWLAENQNSPPFVNDSRAACQPFSFGPRNCLGKNLAKAEMRLTLAKMLYRFEVELCAGQEDWQAKQHIQGFWQKPELLVNFRHVERA